VTFRLSGQALDDLDEITLNEAERADWQHSMDIEAQLWAAMEELGRSPGIGHLRQDIIRQDLYFHYARPYMIVYRRDVEPIAIVSIVHGSRNLFRILRKRFR
jgi:plasmid stabilization system protein ParE